MKIIKTVVTKCFGCPHLRSIWINEHKCLLTYKLIPHEDIFLEIPEWCPLDDI